MNKNPLKALLIAFFIVAFAAIVGGYFYNRNTEKTAPIGMSLREDMVRPDSHAQGPENAPLTIVEFLDPECEACKAFFPTMKKFLEENKKNVRFVVRYMAFHTSSAMAIAALESAGLQGKYWEYLETLFVSAEEWGHKEKPDAAFFEKYAENLGLSMYKFKTDMTDPKWTTLIQRDMADGQTLGVKGTPTIFMNGEKLRSLDYSALVAAASSHLGEAGN
jgi:protein-disulfide isomerase